LYSTAADLAVQGFPVSPLVLVPAMPAMPAESCFSPARRFARAIAGVPGLETAPGAPIFIKDFKLFSV